MNIYGVIMAGGGGSRFWPLSRKKVPKQLLNLTGNGLMINETVDRLSCVTGRENLLIVTSVEQRDALLSATAGRIPAEHILSEPAARNTAPCIAYAAAELTQKYGGGIMIVSPADHFIRDREKFSRTLQTAVKAAEQTGKLITIGISPSFPSTGFGYIHCTPDEKNDVKTVESFHEKPDERTAKEYLKSGAYFWNSGIFIWDSRVILQKLSLYAPDIFEEIEKIRTAMGTEHESTVLQNIYPDIRNISIDYAVMEPSAAQGDVLMVPGNFDWSDVGSWDMMDVLHEPDQHGNVLVGDTLSMNANGCVLYSSGRTIVEADVDNLVIVETPDAVMVCRRDCAQNVRKVTKQLALSGRNELL